MIRRQDRGAVAMIQIEHGKANALDVVLLERLSSELDELDPEARAVVLTGTDQMFSAGIDLPHLLEAGPDYTFALIGALNGLLERFTRLSVPTVAAINGHAIAGGFVLACACDFRLMARGAGKVGLTELQVGVPFPPLALEVVRSAIGDRRARQMVIQARLYSADEAAERELIDGLKDPEVLVEEALKVAAKMAEIPVAAFDLSKRQLMAPLWQRLSSLDDGHEEEVRQTWVADATAEVMQRFVRERIG